MGIIQMSKYGDSYRGIVWVPSAGYWYYTDFYPNIEEAYRAMRRIQH